MEFPRRSLLSGTVVLGSGYTWTSNDSRNIAEVELDLLNTTAQRQVFHFALEFTDGSEGGWLERYRPTSERQSASNPTATEMSVRATGSRTIPF